MDCIVGWGDGPVCFGGAITPCVAASLLDAFIITHGMREGGEEAFSNETPLTSYQQQSASSLSHSRLDIFESVSTRTARQSLPLAKEVRVRETSCGRQIKNLIIYGTLDHLSRHFNSANDAIAIIRFGEHGINS